MKTTGETIIKTVYFFMFCLTVAGVAGTLIFPEEGKLFADYFHLSQIHPAIAVAGIGLILIILLYMLITLFSIITDRSVKEFGNPQNSSQAYPQGQDGQNSEQLTHPKELNLMMGATLEKPKKTREEIESEVIRRTGEVRDALIISSDTIDTIYIPIFIFDSSNTEKLVLISANPKAADMIGAKTESIVGWDIQKVLSAEYNSELKEKIIHVIESGENAQIEFIRHNEAGIDKALNIRIFKISKDRIGICPEDITQEKKELEAIKLEDNRNKQFMDTAGLIIISLDKQGRISTINDTGCQILGQAQDELLGENWIEEFIPDDSREVYSDKFKKIINGQIESLNTEEFPVITYSGENKTIAWNHAIKTDSLGQVNGILCFGNDITSRCDTETALKQSEEDYRTLIEKCNSGVCIIRDKNLIFCNPYIEKITGFSPEELLGHSFLDYIHPDDREWVIDLYRRRMAGEEVKIQYSCRIRNIQNVTRWVEICAAPIVWQGEPATLCVLTDITERNNAEESLKKSETNYRLLTENLMELVIKVSLSGDLEYISPVISGFGGYDPKEEIGQNISKYFADPVQLKKALQVLRLSEKIQDSNTFEFLYKPKTGDPFHVETTTNPLIEDGKVTSIQCALRDITERKQAEIALKESEARFRSVLESVPYIAVQGYNQDRRIIYWNLASEQLYGFTKDEAMGKTLSEMMTRTDNDSTGEVRDGDNNSQSHTGNYGINHKDGSIVPVFSSHLTLQNARGENEIYCLDVDLTELREAQEQQQVLQEKLERAERMESLGVLAGGVAHDLNNMLGPLVGYSDLILSQLDEDSPIKKHVMRIGKSAENAAEVIQDLLSLARRGRYEISPIILNNAVNDYLDSPSFYKLTTDNPGVKVKTNFNDPQPFILGSIPHLSKVIMNLIVNAFDAMPDGGNLDITIERKHITSLLGGYSNIIEDNYILLKVKDTGIGIAEEDLDKILEPYYSKKQMGVSGSGLGLAVVYGIVKDHKGFYDIFSTEGEGSEFILYFPATLRSKEVSNLQRQEFHGTNTILIVDDDSKQCELAFDLLSSLDYKVSSVENGHDAVSYLKENQVDLVVLDMIMEDGYDGLDTYRNILRINPHQKAIIISGFSATDRVNEMQKLGAGGYVQKPFTRYTLSNAIHDELNRVHSPIASS